MTREQFLLIKLTEECAEVAQRALKQIQFGANQIQKGNEVKDGVAPSDKEAGLTNAQRLKNELTDLYVMVNLLQLAGQLSPTTSREFKIAKQRKVEKLNKYLAFSRQQGEIDGDWII
jgi:NTP pyrophosphatase (non-canonical NTP hydrolase)